MTPDLKPIDVTKYTVTESGNVIKSKTMTEVDKAFLKYYGLDDSEIEHAEEEWDFREEDNYDLFKAGADCRQAEIDELKEQVMKMKWCINDLVHLGEFNENTDEEYLNYQVHEALKNAEQFIKDGEVKRRISND